MTHRLVVADDEQDIRAYLEVTLEMAGYEVVLAADGQEALEVIREVAPDAILLDVMMPRMDGLEVLRRLREDARTSHLPILLLTARAQRDDLTDGLDAGADDYVTKPFVADELLARLRAVLRRADQQRARNPLTGLPGNEKIVAELTERLADDQPLALLYVDLDQFKPFNDYYGWMRGDEVIRGLADILREVEHELGGERAFVGHIGGDDFVVIVAPEQAVTVARQICERFDRLAPTLYDPVDRMTGAIEVADRRGVPQRYSLLSLSIGIASSDRREFAHQGEVVTVATEMKRYAKSQGGGRSTYAIDRRSDDPTLELEFELP